MIAKLLLALTLAAPVAASGAEIDTAAGLRVGSLEATHSNGTVYRFPLIEGESLAGSRINTYLQTLELRKLPGRYEKSAFEDVWPEEGSHHGVSELGFTSVFHQPGILSVGISTVYYGASPSETEEWFYFDARTGEVITLRSLLSAPGLAKLDEEITQARLRQVDDFLAGKPLSDGTQLRSDPGEAEEQKQMYRECRAWIAKGHPTGQDRFALERERLTFTREPCGPRVMLALDDIVFRDAREFEAIAGLMNDYGRCLLIARRTDCQRGYSGIAAGVYRGKLGGRYPITLVVESVGSSGQVQATYYYDKHAKPIDLIGAEAKDGVVQLDERGSPPARFALRMQPDGRLLGDWTQEGKPPLSVELR